MNNRGEILVENIIFIVLNLIFLTILILFIARQGEGVIVVEESYAKEIALMIDAAQPGMTLRFDMKDGKELAEKNRIGFSDIVKIDGNVVNVKLSKDSGYSYSFFNDIAIDNFGIVENEDDYFILIGGYNNE